MTIQENDIANQAILLGKEEETRDLEDYRCRKRAEFAVEEVEGCRLRPDDYVNNVLLNGINDPYVNFFRQTREKSSIAIAMENNVDKYKFKYAMNVFSGLSTKKLDEIPVGSKDIIAEYARAAIDLFPDEAETILSQYKNICENGSTRKNNYAIKLQIADLETYVGYKKLTRKDKDKSNLDTIFGISMELLKTIQDLPVDKIDMIKISGGIDPIASYAATLVEVKPEYGEKIMQIYDVIYEKSHKRKEDAYNNPAAHFKGVLSKVYGYYEYDDNISPEQKTLLNKWEEYHSSAVEMRDVQKNHTEKLETNAKETDYDDYPDCEQNNRNLERDIRNIKTASNEDKLAFINKYGFLFDSGQMDEDTISRITISELSHLVKDTFSANKDEFKNDRGLFINAISILERSDPDDKNVRSQNVMTLVDMFKYCGEQENCTFSWSLGRCGENMDAKAAHYVCMNLEEIVKDKDVARIYKKEVLRMSPEYAEHKKRTDSKVAERKEAILEGLYQAKGKRDANPGFDYHYGPDTRIQRYVFDTYLLPTRGDVDKQLEMVNKFLSDGLDVNMDISNGSRLLHYVEDAEAVKKIYEHGADITAVNNYGETALFDCETVEKTQFLLECGVDANAANCYGDTALSRCETVEKAQLLLNYGADPLIVNVFGRDMIEELEANLLHSNKNLSYDKDDNEVYEYSDEDKKIIALVKNKARDMKLAQVRAKANKHNDISGVVVADKIAEGMTSGVVTEPVTPKKGKEMSDNIKRKYFQNKRQNG